jgi:DNA helicase HerA-like ATPase
VQAIKDIYEKAGLFYLGKDVNKENFDSTDVLTLLKNKNFTTHAAIIGMTGSGKTGLGIGLLEEAAIDNIPSIVIDPKGDMGNMLLTDPTFSPLSFKPWVEDDAKAKGEDALDYAAKTANMWRDGILSSNQDEARVAKFHE